MFRRLRGLINLVLRAALRQAAMPHATQDFANCRRQ